MDKIFLLLLSPPDAESQQVSWYFSAATHTSKPANSPSSTTSRGTGSIDDFARIYSENFPDTEIAAVISGQYLTYTNVAMAVRNQKQMLQALPFLVEEQVIGNIEDMHIAIPENISGDSIRIAIIEKAVFDKLKNIFFNHKLPVNEIFGLPDLLTCHNNELQILLHDDYSIVKGPTDCFQCDQVNLETMLELISLDNITAITISLHELNKHSLSLAKRIKNKFGSDLLKVKSSIFTEDLLDYIIRSRSGDALSCLNILHGDLSSGASRNRQIQQLLPLAWVAVLCLSLQIAFNIASGLYFNRLSDRTYQNAVALYLQLFPEDKKVVNLAAQLNAKTKSSNLDLKASRFPVVFASTIAAMNSVGLPKDIKLKQFRYDEESGELKIGLDTSSIALLDKFKNKLSEINFLVEIISANEDGGLIKATVSIKNA